MTPYILESDTRARRSAKEARALLAARGVDVTLKQSQNLVARMLGHADWTAMSQTLGTGRSPDDADVPAAERDARWTGQRAALVQAGLPEGLAEEVRARLALTGRSSKDAEEKEVALLDMTYEYHPERLLEALDAALDFREEVAHINGRRASRDVYSLAEDMKAWIGDDYVVTPLDKESVDGDYLDKLSGLAAEVLEDSGKIVDAARMVAEFSSRDVGGETYEKAWDDLGTAYVHFGTNALPSPFPGCGIEGCYLKIIPWPQGDERAVEFTFVASPEMAPSMDIAEDPTTHAYDQLVFSLRHVTLAGSTEHGPLALGAILDGDDWDAASVSTISAWRPYLRAAFNVAWNALKAEREATIKIVDGVHVDTSPATVRKLKRARTDAQMKSALRALADEGSLLSRHLGGVPVDSAPATRELSETQVTDADAWARSYLRMAGEAAYPEFREVFARKSLHILANAGRGEFLFNAQRSVAWGHAHLAEALTERGMAKEAAKTALSLLKADPSDYLGYRCRAAVLQVMAGNVAEATRLMKQADRTDDATKAWTDALVHAAAGRTELRDAALAEAMRLAPGVADRLSSRDHMQENWMDQDAAADEGFEYVVAGVVRQGWNAVDPGKTLLSRVVREHSERDDVATGVTAAGVAYQVLPYSNAMFEASVAGNRSVGYSSGRIEKANGHVASRSGVFDAFRLFEMDTCTSSVKAHPFQMRMSRAGRTCNLAPDLEVTTAAGENWYFHLDVGMDPWVRETAVSTFAALGMPLVLVSPKFAQTPVARYIGWAESRTRNVRVTEEFGSEVAAAVRDAGGKISFPALFAELRAGGWDRRDPRYADSWEANRAMGEDRFFEAFFLGKVVRAAREGYVDLDPIHDKAPLQGFVHPRNEFLDLRDAARTLCRAATAGSVHKVMEMSGRAQAIVRSLPDPSVETARPGFGA